jgi:hypothetical protein
MKKIITIVAIVGLLYMGQSTFLQPRLDKYDEQAEAFDLAREALEARTLRAESLVPKRDDVEAALAAFEEALPPSVNQDALLERLRDAFAPGVTILSVSVEEPAPTVGTRRRQRATAAGSTAAAAASGPGRTFDGSDAPASEPPQNYSVGVRMESLDLETLLATVEAIEQIEQVVTLTNLNLDYGFADGTPIEMSLGFSVYSFTPGTPAPPINPRDAE